MWRPFFSWGRLCTGPRWWKNESNQQTVNYSHITVEWNLNDPNSTIKSAKSWFLVTPAAFGRLSSLETSSFAETPALHWRPSPSPGCGRRESCPHSADPSLHGPSSQPDALINDRIFRGSTWGFAMESDGTWWNYILGVGTWDYPQELDGKTWKNNKPFKAFQALRRNDFFSDFPSFQIPSITIQQNLALSEIKDGTIFPTERGYRRTKSKITAETVAPFRSFQYLSVVAQVKRSFMKYFRCCLSPEVN